MPTRTHLICIATAFFAHAGSSQAASMTTQSTPTSGADCVNLSYDRETGDTVKRCPGISGLALIIHRSDDRASLSILTREKATLPLNFWDTVTPTFSTLGPKVEWQLETIHGKHRLVAIVVRIDTVDQTDVSAPQPISFIVVARIRNDQACVIGKIPAKQTNAAQAARALAIAPGSKCLPHLSAWRSSDNVMKQGKRIARGAAIATFNKSGRYSNIAHGNHAALVLRVMGSGIWVVEQWKNISGGVIKIRLIRVPPPRQQFNTDGSYKDPSNNALAFRTIER